MISSCCVGGVYPGIMLSREDCFLARIRTDASSAMILFVSRVEKTVGIFVMLQSTRLHELREFSNL